MKAEDVGKAVGSALLVIAAAGWTWWRRRKAAKSLSRHPFFAECAEKQRWARHLLIEDDMRREAFQDLIGVKLGIWHHEMGHLVADLPIRTISAEELAVTLHAFVDRVVGTYTVAAKDRGIPAVIVDKFSTWHGPAVTGAHTFVDSICDSDWHTPPEMMASFLSWMVAALEQTVVHAEETLADMNGEVNGMVYKGYVAQSYESPKRRRKQRSRDGDEP